ncbi:hypothetical protein [Frateuria soli]|uniref:hypothetical protein n=1 Tax=Frateuria soli TaxID=1542730 RepID=UPI001E5E73CC|nr:hypothetical protein [Frateuria soli]UGB38847.1 hypothetical protein LQ771_03035 [Frateuria soli]
MVASPMEKRPLASIRGNKRLPSVPGEDAPPDSFAPEPCRPAARRRASTVRRCAATILVAGLATLPAACSSPMDDIKLNPHPVQRYELIATVDAPGEFDSVEGYLSYDVTNVECVPKNPVEGARNVPNTSRSFVMIRVDAHTWKGSFYRDLLQDEDYFGLGVCHWDIGTVSPGFVVHGQTFGPGLMLPAMLSDQPFSRYFSKSDYLNRSNNDANAGVALERTIHDEEVRKHPERFFLIEVRISKVAP